MVSDIRNFSVLSSKLVVDFLITDMPPKSAAERMKAYRSRMSEEKKTLMQGKNKGQQQKSRGKWDENRKKLEIELSKVRTRKSRNKRTETKTLLPTGEYPSTAFGSAQSMCKAINKVGKALPKSPRKQAAIVKKLAKQFGLELKAKEAEKIPTALEILIVKFYESDSISRQQPGKKDFVTVRGHDGKKERVQKKILMTTVMEAFKQFKVEHPEIKIGKSKFASLRPPHVLPVSDKDHTVCCCVYHENFEMVLTGIRKVQNVPQPDELVKAAACNWCLDCYLGKCDECADVEKKVEPVFKVERDSTVGDVDCPYFQWNDENKKTSVASTLAEAQREAMKQLAVMKRHCFIAKTQLHQMRTLKQSLGDTECVIQEDFAENFNIKQQDEIMSAHWVTNGVTLFTAVLNTKDGSKSYVVVSDDLHHDKFAVTAFNRAILADAAESGTPLERLHFFSDGAGSQFKNRFTLSILLRPTLLHSNVQEVDWSFFGTAHGKGPVDGVGGTVKRAVWRRILQGQVTISTPHEFAAVAKEACPNVRILFIDAAQVATTHQELESLWEQNRPQSIPNTRQAHYLANAIKIMCKNKLHACT